MIKLIPISQPDFDSFLERDISTYAEQKVRSGNWQPEEALELSRKEHAQLLPEGRASKDQYLYTITEEGTGQKLGILWVNVKMEGSHKVAWIYDIEIDEAFRGKGYGKAALSALDELLTGMGVENVGLHVFGYNTTAFELYKKMGYEVTNIIMRKDYPHVG